MATATATMTTDKWYSLEAYNTETQYGYGTEAEADKYCDWLNRNRESNLYYAIPVEDNEQITRLDVDQSYGFNLGDALNEID